MRILVYNIAYGTGSPVSALEMAAGIRNYIRTPERYLDAITKLVRRCRVDVAGFLEVDRGSFRTGGRNQLLELSQAVGSGGNVRVQHKYQPGSTLGRLPYLRHQTNALLVRDPLRQEHWSDFMPCGAKRLILGCCVEDAVEILLVHLALGGGVRQKQLDYLARLVENKKRCIVCGDFNTFDPGRDLEKFLNRTGMKSANSGHENTYPARKPCRELDYILYSPDLPLKSFRVIPFPGSDHLPLLAEFDLSACSALKNA